MKKLLIVLILIPCFSVAQSKKIRTQKKQSVNVKEKYKTNGIDGIGPLRINGTTVKIIDSLWGLAKIRIYYYDDIIKSDAPSMYPKIREHKKFTVSSMTFANMVFKDIELDFYNDTLYELTVHDLPLGFTEAMILKYGDPEVTVKKNPITCKTRLGSYDEEEKTVTSIYRSDKKIFAFHSISIYFDSKCEKQGFGYYDVQSVEKSDKVRNLEMLESEKIEKAEKEKKKSSLNDL